MASKIAEVDLGPLSVHCSHQAVIDVTKSYNHARKFAFYWSRHIIIFSKGLLPSEQAKHLGTNGVWTFDPLWVSFQ